MGIRSYLHWRGIQSWVARVAPDAKPWDAKPRDAKPRDASRGTPAAGKKKPPAVRGGGGRAGCGCVSLSSSSTGLFFFARLREILPDQLLAKRLDEKFPPKLPGHTLTLLAAQLGA